MQHPTLANGRWNTFSFVEQMANIGSEVHRTISWKKKQNKEFSDLAFFRALELLDLTIADSKNRDRLKELTRARELFCDYIIGNNIYNNTDTLWQNYFLSFTSAARRNT